MLTSRIAAAAVATGALLVTASPAFAGVEVNPNPVKPGGSVTVNDSFGSQLCPTTDKTATATSNGFVGGSISMTRGTMALVGSGKAVSKPGTYMVSITCASGLSSGPGTYNLVVAPRGGARTGDGASMAGVGGENAGIAMLAGAGVLGLGALALRRRANAGR